MAEEKDLFGNFFVSFLEDAEKFARNSQKLLTKRNCQTWRPATRLLISASGPVLNAARSSRSRLHPIPKPPSSSFPFRLKSEPGNEREGCWRKRGRRRDQKNSFEAEEKVLPSCWIGGGGGGGRRGWGPNIRSKGGAQCWVSNGAELSDKRSERERRR